MSNRRRFPTQSHAFVVRIWWESGSLRPDRRPLWRGRVQHVASNEYVVFQTLSELTCFIQQQTGDPEQADDTGDRGQDR